jgi:quercetin dioxygenase-like cupin family protein
VVVEDGALDSKPYELPPTIVIVDITEQGEAIMIRFPVVILGAVVLMAPVAAKGEDVPDALSVEWRGKKPCERLYEDAQIRVLRCSFAPGDKHLRHSHPALFAYVLSGGKMEVVDAKGTQQYEDNADEYFTGGAIPWHEATNVGSTTVRYLLVEKKY